MNYILTKICKTSDIGINNNLFGGTMMSWLDEGGETFACDACHTPRMVTLKINETIFKKPVKVGEHIKLYGEIKKMGKTSITIYIEARKANFCVYDSTEEVVVHTEAVYVKIDENGQSIPI